MEKVEITVEQAAAIEFLKNGGYEDKDIIATAMAGEWYNEPNFTEVESLNTMETRTLVYAVDGHYVISAELTLGDYVVFSHKGGGFIRGESDLALARLNHKEGKVQGYFPAKSYIKLEASQ